MRNKMMMDELIPFSHSQSNKKVCGKMIINIIGVDEAFQFKKFAHANASSTTATKKKALLVYCSVSHYSSKYSYNCRERPEVTRLVTLADNTKVPLDVDFSVMFPLFPIWRSVVNSHSN
jgi:hypothetical protein